MDVYQQIKSRYGFAIPEEYRGLEANGWLAWSEKNTDYLWINEGEWLSPDEILNYQFEDYHKQGFVPFALAGNGDLWCWYPEWATREATPVVYCPHDCYDGSGYAPSFLGWMFRTIVEFASAGGLIMNEATARIHFARWQKDVVPLLPAAWGACVNDIVGKPVKTWPEERGFGGPGFISMHEAQDIIRSYLAFPHLDEELRWMIPVEEMDLSLLSKK